MPDGQPLSSVGAHPTGNLGRAMRHLNGVYTQRFNRLEQTDGPLFRGRYKAILVDADRYLLAVSRYIHLNPVAAGTSNTAIDFAWSSYRAYDQTEALSLRDLRAGS